MAEAGCRQMSGPPHCVDHEDWDLDRDVCTLIDQAVAIGYSTGRRDALTEAADAVESEQRIAHERLDALRKAGAERRITMGIAQGLLMSLNRIVALSDNEETKP